MNRGFSFKPAFSQLTEIAESVLAVLCVMHQTHFAFFKVPLIQLCIMQNSVCVPACGVIDSRQSVIFLHFTQQFGIFFIQSVAALGIPYLMYIFWERSVVQLTMVTCLNMGVQHSQGSPDGFGKTIIQVTEKRGLDYSACHGEWVRTLDEAVPDHRTRWKHKSL